MLLVICNVIVITSYVRFQQASGVARSWPLGLPRLFYNANPPVSQVNAVEANGNGTLHLKIMFLKASVGSKGQDRLM